MGGLSSAKRTPDYNDTKIVFTGCIVDTCFRLVLIPGALQDKVCRVYYHETLVNGSPDTRV